MPGAYFCVQTFCYANNMCTCICIQTHAPLDVCMHTRTHVAYIYNETPRTASSDVCTTAMTRAPHLWQTWKDNMGVAGKVSITSSKSDYTMVSFKPDLAKFKMTHLDKDTVALMTRRAYDIAGCTRGVSVTLNGKKLPVSGMGTGVCSCLVHIYTLYLCGQNFGWNVFHCW